MTKRELLETLTGCDDDAPITVLDATGDGFELEDSMIFHELDSEGKWHIVITPIGELIRAERKARGFVTRG